MALFIKKLKAHIISNRSKIIVCYSDLTDGGIHQNKLRVKVMQSDGLSLGEG